MSSPILPHPYPSRHGSPSGIYVQPGKKGLDKTTGPQQYTVGFKISFPSLVRCVWTGKERWVIIRCPSVCVCVLACAYQRESAFMSNCLPDIRNTIAHFLIFLVFPSEGTKMKLSTQHCAMDTDRGKWKNWEKNLSQCHLVHHKFHIDWHPLNNFSKNQLIPHRKHASFLWQILIGYCILVQFFCVNILFIPCDSRNKQPPFMIAVTIVTTSFYRHCIYDIHTALTISSYCVPITVKHVVFF